MKIALIGMPATGKTSMGRRLAKHYGLAFDDLDQLLVRELGCSIAEYFEQMGEEAFRDMETRLLQRHAENASNCILATGGGVVLRSQNREILKKHYCVIYLRARPEVLLWRVRNDRTRPLLQVSDPLARLKALYEVRHPLYQETAEFQTPDASEGIWMQQQALYTYLDDKLAAKPRAASL